MTTIYTHPTTYEQAIALGVLLAGGPIDLDGDLISGAGASGQSVSIGDPHPKVRVTTDASERADIGVLSNTYMACRQSRKAKVDHWIVIERPGRAMSFQDVVSAMGANSFLRGDCLDALAVGRALDAGLLPLRTPECIQEFLATLKEMNY